ncbi:MAG: hypothetical protein J2P27_00255 [Actinobacteria bacterium]|nr:hypothetical protein [Actinomycetota bacterium]
MPGDDDPTAPGDDPAAPGVDGLTVPSYDCATCGVDSGAGADNGLCPTACTPHPAATATTSAIANTMNTFRLRRRGLPPPRFTDEPSFAERAEIGVPPGPAVPLVLIELPPIELTRHL